MLLAFEDFLFYCFSMFITAVLLLSEASCLLLDCSFFFVICSHSSIYFIFFLILLSIFLKHTYFHDHITYQGSVINDVIAMFAGRQGRVMVFASTKLDCDTIAMDKTIKHECHVLHGDIPQLKRESTLAAYKSGNFRILICTDVAARGLDLSVELVINVKPPCRMNGKTDVETYVHRSGRTGRAGKAGVCVT